eukprot:CAMPEP_0183340398 /NCGR_PEP_ID=MMETSP0164_2-20130417/6967_1 /TAXON_ID=221442 /ORGANISM="Coccolithus pelagicus ssp braarudi, Strain PLY182g" /LENGTH=121 /DNA_ID=CAMNT_0025510533 /DNA_START=511 /DNA_END=874 /DNA_ORIENTATION=+
MQRIKHEGAFGQLAPIRLLRRLKLSAARLGGFVFHAIFACWPTIHGRAPDFLSLLLPLDDGIPRRSSDCPSLQIFAPFGTRGAAVVAPIRDGGTQWVLASATVKQRTCGGAMPGPRSRRST